MSSLSEFNKTVQISDTWIKEIATGADIGERQALQAFRAVMTALRDRLRIDDAINLAGQLPILLKGYYYDGWVPSDNPSRERTSEDFLDKVQENLVNLRHDMEAEKVTGVVLNVLAKHVSEGTIDSLKRMLPEEFGELWATPSA